MSSFPVSSYRPVPSWPCPHAPLYITTAPPKTPETSGTAYSVTVVSFWGGGVRETHGDSIKVVAGYGSRWSRKEKEMLESDEDGAMEAIAENWEQ